MDIGIAILIVGILIVLERQYEWEGRLTGLIFWTIVMASIFLLFAKAWSWSPKEDLVVPIVQEELQETNTARYEDMSP
jgi:uncharacterized membrane protein YkgB